MKNNSAANKTAFGSKIPGSKVPPKPRPPLPKASQHVDGFDKKEWIREYKLQKKEIHLEERDRFRPLMCLKRDLQEFILE